MTKMTPKLPHGASGIEFGDFVIEFCKDKVVALAKNRDEHYTLHAGQASGILDVHRSWRGVDGIERHQTVFAMQRSDLPALLAQLYPLTIGMFRLFRRLRIGWLHWHNIAIVRGLDPTSDADIAAITRRRPGRKRIVIDEDQLQANIIIPEYLDEIWNFPDGAFSLFRRGRKIGVGIKTTDQSGYAYLYWFKLHDVSKLCGEFQHRFVAVARKYAIPKERYKDYGVLEP
jgi:hypothetical protein